jgi:hypothetical protein
MQTSVFLARLLGPFFLIVGASVLINARPFRAIVDEFIRSPALLFLSGLMILPVGLALVLTHNVWVANWPVLITLLGWLCVIGGAIRLLVPQHVLKISRRFYANPNAPIVSAGIWLVVGAILCFFGYLK